MSKRDWSTDLFSDLFGSSFSLDRWVRATSDGPADTSLRSFRSKATNEGLSVEVDLPGVSPKDVTLWIDDNQLIVKGVKGDRKFTNRYTIAPEYNVASAKASMSNGQLNVSLSKAEASKPKRIDIVIA